MPPVRRVKRSSTSRPPLPKSRVSLERALALQREESRRHAELWLDLTATLETSLARYVSIFEEAPVAYLVLDASGIILQINAAGTALLGASRDRLTDKPLLLFVERADRNALVGHLRESARGRGVTELRLGRDAHDATAVQLTSQRAWLPPPAGGIVFHTIITDISDRRRSEEALRSSEKQHRQIVETANEGICIVDDHNHIVFANRRFANMVGTTAEDLVGRSAFDLIADEDRAASERRFNGRDLAALGQSDERLRRVDGSTVWTSLSTTMLRDADGRFTGLLHMYTDATARHELVTSREMAVRAIIGAQEQERQRIARELHDQLGQHIVALSLGLARLAQATSDNPVLTPLIDQLRGVADLLGRDVHTLALELRPTALDQLGLSVALSSYADDVAARSGLDIDVHCDGPDRFDLSTASRTGIYRIAQEALTNVVKHARARHVSVILERRDNMLQLIVEDDGVGFNQLGGEGEKLGLSGMQERASLLGGSVTIESSPGRGTTVYARIPLSATEVHEDGETTPTAPG